MDGHHLVGSLLPSWYRVSKIGYGRSWHFLRSPGIVTLVQSMTVIGSFEKHMFWLKRELRYVWCLVFSNPTCSINGILTHFWVAFASNYIAIAYMNQISVLWWVGWIGLFEHCWCMLINVDHHFPHIFTLCLYIFLDMFDMSLKSRD